MSAARKGAVAPAFALPAPTLGTEADMLQLGRLAAAAWADHVRAEDAELAARDAGAELAALHAKEAMSATTDRMMALDAAAGHCRPEGLAGALYAVVLAADVALGAEACDMTREALDAGMADVLRLLLPIAGILARERPDAAAALDVARLLPTTWAPAGVQP